MSILATRFYRMYKLFFDANFPNFEELNLKTTS